MQVVAGLGAVLDDGSRKWLRGEALALQAALHVGEGEQTVSIRPACAALRR
jgi:hypothetical protein